MTEFYIGITVGPIIETLTTASRPAALWCASSMFSWLTEDLCNGIKKIGGDIISPYYPTQKAQSDYSVVTGKAGKYHDRIICTLEADSSVAVKTNIDKVIEDSKLDLARILTESFTDNNKDDLMKALVQYLQVHYIVEEKTSDLPENCILRLSPYLDAAELCPVFNADQTLQPILRLFEGKNDEARNAFLKKCFNIKDGHTSLLNSDGNIRDIEHIADSCQNNDRKIFNYYAIVQADGDCIGKLLETLHSDEEIERFSMTCLNYTSDAADMIAEFGGVVIYAGGDDLLFIAPLENPEKKNIFQLCNDITGVFREKFKGFKNVPTLSFGISINYKHFPLYEALSDALGLLEKSKDVPKGKPKNKTTVRIRKSSGQSTKFRYTNGSDVFVQFDKLLKSDNDAVVLNSMLYKIGLYKPILIAALSQKMNLFDAFKNLFDSEYHGTVSNYIKTVCDALKEIHNYIKDNTDESYALERISKKKAENNEEIAVDLLYSMLRTTRFFSEKRGSK